MACIPSIWKTTDGDNLFNSDYKRFLGEKSVHLFFPVQGNQEFFFARNFFLGGGGVITLRAHIVKQDIPSNSRSFPSNIIKFHNHQFPCLLSTSESFSPKGVLERKKNQFF